MRRDLDRLEDILEAIEAIERYAGRGRDVFDRDELVRVWCLRHLEVIGEASARLSDELRVRHPQVPWREIIGMRHVLAHGYFDVDWEQVWTAADRDVPALRDAVRAIWRAEGGRSLESGEN